MKDRHKTEEQLMNELLELRQRIAELEIAETQRKLAEEALRESEAKFRNLFEHAKDAIFLADPQTGIIVDANSAACSMLGLPKGKVVGMHQSHLHPPEEVERYKEIFRDHVEKGTAVTEDLLVQRSDGSRVPVDILASVVELAAGKSIIQGSFRDITERKRAEEELKQSLDKLRRMLEQTVNALASTVEIRDPYTAGHQRRVTRLACAIAGEMGLREWQIEAIRVAGALHDTGKIGVPTRILNKPGKLSDLEMALIKTHSQSSYDIVRGIQFLWPVAQIILQHHERLDGSGYPAGLSGDEIILEARILAVADVVEAMSSHRPHRPSLGLDKALEEISQNRGITYEPEVVDACLKLFTEKGFKFD